MAITEAKAHRYLTAISYGPTPETVSALSKAGMAKWVSQQLNPKFANKEALIDDSFLAHSLSVAEVAQHPIFMAVKGRVTTELTLATAVRQSYSKRQLFEMLVEHFNDYLHTPLSYDGRIFRVAYDRDVIRKYTLGTFPDMLVASTFHPAMMAYLNLDKNTAQRPNENFGRELLELFTVTPSAGYTEADVLAASKLLTGFTWNTKKGALAVNVAKHHFGSVSVMGFKHANPATKDPAEVLARGEELVRYLALQPATAKAFSIRLARRFYSESPDAGLVSDLAAVYTSTNGNIPKVVEALLLHPKFLNNPVSKVKRPAEFVASTVRALQVAPTKPLIGGNASKPSAYFTGTGASALSNLAKAQGHLPMNWPFPNGYPDVALAWTTLSSQVQRWNAVADLTFGRAPKTWGKPDLLKLFPSLNAESTPAQIVAVVSQRLLGDRLPASKASAIVVKVRDLSTSANPATALEQKLALAVVAVLSSPEWMLR